MRFVAGMKQFDESVISRSFSRSFASAFFDGVTLRYRRALPFRSWSYRNVYPRKSKLTPSCFSRFTLVLSRLMTSPSQSSSVDSVHCLSRVPWYLARTTKSSA